MPAAVQATSAHSNNRNHRVCNRNSCRATGESREGASASELREAAPQRITFTECGPRLSRNRRGDMLFVKRHQASRSAPTPLLSPSATDGEEILPGSASSAAAAIKSVPAGQRQTSYRQRRSQCLPSFPRRAVIIAPYASFRRGSQALRWTFFGRNPTEGCNNNDDELCRTKEAQFPTRTTNLRTRVSGLAIVRLTIGAMLVWVFFENLGKGLYTPEGYAGLINYYIKASHSPAAWKAVMGFMASHAAIAAPMQGMTEISLGILLVTGLLTRPVAFVAFLFLASLWMSEWGTAWIWELLVPVLASLALAVGRAGRAWGVDAWLARRWPSSPWW